MQHFDFVFTGAGLSGLMTAWRLSGHVAFRDKTMLLIDREEKSGNDRTWCFWEQGTGEFDHVVSARWHSADFMSDSVKRRMVLAPFVYKMIKSSELYAKLKRELSATGRVTFVKQEVIGFSDAGSQVIISTKDQTYSAYKLFNSLPNLEKAQKQKEYPVLLQHFIGWKVRTANPIFDPKSVTFMDFTVPQKGNTRFMYVLPFSDREALVEYTLFSKNLLPQHQYEEAIRSWLDKHGAGDFEILETEQGAIPMTCFPFERLNTPNIINIGSAGGWTKASTGYTFANTARLSALLVQRMADGDDLKGTGPNGKFRFYDTIFLDVLARQNEIGHRIFSSMFASNTPETIFRFLDETSTFSQDFKIIKSCPKLPFIKALLRRL